MGGPVHAQSEGVVKLRSTWNRHPFGHFLLALPVQEALEAIGGAMELPIGSVIVNRNIPLSTEPQDLAKGRRRRVDANSVRARVHCDEAVSFPTPISPACLRTISMPRITARGEITNN